MKSLLVLLVILSACTTGRVTRFADSDRAAITQVLEDQRLAWNRGDIEAFMEGYARSEELVFTSGAQIRKGWQGTLERYRSRYGADSSTMGTLRFEVLGVQALGGEGAVVLGRWGLSGLPKPGGGIFSVVFERRPEGWKIVHDHTSSDPEPAASSE